MTGNETKQGAHEANVASKPVQKKEYKSPNKERFILIFLIIALVLSVFGYAMTVDKFTDYEPPSTLVIRWGDYIDSVSGEIKTDNSVTSSPTWRAEYPYRALFLGRQYGSASSSKLNTQSIYIIYSKKPVTDLFTFKYHGNRTYPRTGFIRAQFNKRVFLENDDIKILHHTYDISSNEPISPYLYTNIETNNTWILSHTDDSGPLYELYFDFDFYYDCTNKHQQSTQLLDVSGLRNITDVPYAYILTCDGHGSGGGSTSGGGSSGGSSSGSGGSSSSKKGSDYSTADNGSYPAYSSRPDHELSVPDDWKSSSSMGNNSGSYPFENDKNTPNLDWGISEKPYQIQGDGDTGGNNDVWESPAFDIPLELPFNTDDLTIPDVPLSGNVVQGYPDIPLPDNLQENTPVPPELLYPNGWPPPCPLY